MIVSLSPYSLSDLKYSGISTNNPFKDFLYPSPSLTNRLNSSDYFSRSNDYDSSYRYDTSNRYDSSNFLDRYRAQDKTKKEGGFLENFDWMSALIGGAVGLFLPKLLGGGKEGGGLFGGLFGA
jgi:hypothetical protein